MTANPGCDLHAQAHYRCPALLAFLPAEAYYGFLVRTGILPHAAHTALEAMDTRPDSTFHGEPARGTDTHPATDVVRGRDAETIRLSPTVRGPAPAAALRTAHTAQSLYEILEEIGHGGMSIVYLARDRRLGRFVALKRLGSAFQHTPSMQERFFREATSIATLNHPHIVHLYDLAEDDQGPFIVMEYVPGPGQPAAPDRPAPSLNLEQKIAHQGAPLSFRASVELVRKLCRAMDYAHTHDVIHRDLKPSNILLDESGEPKIVDFGLARRTTQDEVRLTLTGAKLLSLGYSAPEQETDTSAVDQRADVYGLGGILYFSLTGENPRFFRESKVPPLIRPALLRALENDRGRRWASVREFEEALFQEGNLYSSPTTDMGMWRCKWCNGLNPMGERYCEACGGDGREICPECAGETRIGVRFCPACNADIKAFEEARGLLERLRQLRRQKDFPRMAIEKDAAARFQPSGDKGRALQNEITELLDTAGWALRRKEDLERTIQTGMDKGDYEQVRDRLSEFELLDESAPYVDLKAGLPWRVAERDLAEFTRHIDAARTLCAAKKLTDCHRAIEELNVRKAQIYRLESYFPLLKGKLTLSAEPVPPGDDRTLAIDLENATTRLRSLEDEVARAEARANELTREMEEALRAHQYDRCLALAEEVRDVTVDPTPASEIAARAAAVLDEVAAHLRRAEQALAFGKYRAAERLCYGITERLQRNSAPAQALLSRIARQRRRHMLRVGAGSVCAALTLYLLSVAPVYRLAEGGRIAADRELLRALYAPVRWLHARTVLRHPLEAYSTLLGVHPFTPDT